MITSVMVKLAIDMGYYYDPSIYDESAPYAGTALAGAGLGAVAGGVGARMRDDKAYRDARKAAMSQIREAKKARSADMRGVLREFDRIDTPTAADSAAFKNNIQAVNNSYEAAAKKAVDPVRTAYKARFRVLPKLRWIGKGALLGTAGAGALMLGDRLINNNEWNR